MWSDTLWWIGGASLLASFVCAALLRIAMDAELGPPLLGIGHVRALFGRYRRRHPALFYGCLVGLALGLALLSVASKVRPQ
jgi:hypothetical protein